MGRLEVIPMSRKGAEAYVLAYHRHSGRVAGMKFAIGCREKEGQLVLGIALVGRPVSRNLDDGWTLEVNRLCTEGHENVGSFLYAAAWRATKALGYTRLVTYTLASESGASLRGAGWRVIAERRKKTGWKSTQRPNPAEYLSTQRVLWEAGPETSRQAVVPEEISGQPPSGHESPVEHLSAGPDATQRP